MDWLLSPPIAFLILIAVIFLVAFILKGMAFKGKKDLSKSALRAYSCGEDFTGHMVQPDYSQFFSFAFFFTLLHVVAMVIATVPADSALLVYYPIVYALVAIVGLVILLRR